MEALSLFSGYGIELEYMIVDKNDLSVKPITDKIFYDLERKYVSDIYRGRVEWSNELVLHVIEIKTSKPDADLKTLAESFTNNILEINQLLSHYNAKLLPGAMHPFMDPFKEMELWPHDNRDIYDLYNKIFDCRGHGWSNLQSMHINLPFANDKEFEKLHAAIRVLLPIIPALSAASPVCDSSYKGYQDYRLEVYRHNQEKVPLIAGKIIPEQAFNREEYYKKIFDPLFKAISSYDKTGILQEEWLNSRGAIARFDRNAIEIRIIDVQECANADIAIASLVIDTLKNLVNEKFSSLNVQKDLHEDDLLEIFLDVIKNGDQSIITDQRYLSALGIEKEQVPVKEIWNHLLAAVPDKDDAIYAPVKTILEHGNLSVRIMNALNNDYSRENIIKVYDQLSVCLRTNSSFVPVMVTR